MVSFRKVVLATVAIGILSFGTFAKAGDIIYNNLPNISSTAGSSAVSVVGASFDSFSTGGSASLLTDVKMILSGIPDTAASFTVSLLSDSSTTPGLVLTTLGTFNDNSLVATGINGGSLYDVMLTTPFALKADTRYWVELSGPSSSVNWDYATDAAGVGVSGEYNAYGLIGPPVVFSNGLNTGPFQMEVTTVAASAVPEPGTLCQALSALGIGAIAITRRRMVRS